MTSLNMSHQKYSVFAKEKDPKQFLTIWLKCVCSTLKLKNLWEGEKSWKRSLAHLLTVGTWKSSNKLSYNVTTLAFFSESFPLFWLLSPHLSCAAAAATPVKSKWYVNTVWRKNRGKRRNFLWSTSVATLGTKFQKVFSYKVWYTFLEFRQGPVFLVWHV